MTADDYRVKPVRLALGLVACIGIVATFFTLLFGFKAIPANSVGVKTRFGGYHALVDPGLAYAIRVTKGRKPLRDEELEKSGTLLPSSIPEIEFGRGEIEKQITERTRQKIADFGIELLDERFKRSKYDPAVAEKIIQRMSSERHQIAAKFRSEGRGEAANINGQKESDVASISSTATKNVLEIEGKADAEAAAIYAAAFSSPDGQELYSFLRILDVMRAAFEKDTTAVISTNSDLGRMLKSMAEAIGAPKPNR